MEENLPFIGAAISMALTIILGWNWPNSQLIPFSLLSGVLTFLLIKAM